MLEYKVTNNQRGAVIVQGDFAPGSLPVTIPDTNKKKKSFISLFLNKRDIERAIDFLNCISMNNHPIANEGLFISALAMFAKCFVNAEARNSLDKGRFKSFAPQFAESFDKYDAWRNKHFLHDENSMTEATAFLLVAPEGSESSLGGPPSVIWNSVQINYIEERKHLEMLLQEIWKYIVYLIDNQGASIETDYCNKTREELLGFGAPPFKLATTNAPEKKR